MMFIKNVPHYARHGSKVEHMLYVLGLVNCYFGVVNIHAWILGFWDDLKDILG